MSTSLFIILHNHYRVCYSFIPSEFRSDICSYFLLLCFAHNSFKNFHELFSSHFTLHSSPIKLFLPFSLRLFIQFHSKFPLFRPELPPALEIGLLSASLAETDYQSCHAILSLSLQLRRKKRRLSILGVGAGIRDRHLLIWWVITNTTKIKYSSVSRGNWLRRIFHHLLWKYCFFAHKLWISSCIPFPMPLSP